MIKPNFLHSQRLHLLIILILTFLAYSNIFQNGFVLDDKGFITAWSIPKSFSNIPKVFAYDSVPSGAQGYRPVRAIFYMILFKLFGENITGYHLVTLLVHLASTTLVYLITRFILNLTKSQHPGILALTTALLFGLHPVHTEAVTFITAGMDSISFLFYFLAVYLYLVADKSQKLNKFYILSLVCAFISIFSNEISVTLPLTILAYEVILNRGRSSLKKIFASKFKFILPFFAITLIYLFIRMGILQIVGRGDYLAGSVLLTLLTSAKAILTYMYLLIWPANLSVNPTLIGGIKSHIDSNLSSDLIASQTLTEPLSILSLSLITGFLILAWRTKRKHPRVTFAISWFFICLLPVSYLIPQGFILQERYIYLASFGFTLLLTLLLARGFKVVTSLSPDSILKVKSKKQNFVLFFAVCLLVAAGYGIRTYYRNMDFKDEFTLWKNMASQFPEDAQANYVTANFYFERNQLDLSKDYFRKVISIEPKILDAHYKLGLINLKLNRQPEAVDNFKQVLILNPDFFSARLALNRLGIKTATGPANLDQVDWVKYDYQNTLSFYYPAIWSVRKLTDRLLISDNHNTLTIELSLDKKQPDKSAGDYLNTQTDRYGSLETQHSASVPNQEEAYVRVWNDQVKKLQVFLFQGDQVIKILVSPADSPLIKQFDSILGSIQLQF